MPRVQNLQNGIKKSRQGGGGYAVFTLFWTSGKGMSGSLKNG